MPYNLVNYTFRRIHKNGGRADEPGVEHENEAFSTGQKKYIRRVLKCLDSMLIPMRSKGDRHTRIYINMTML